MNERTVKVGFDPPPTLVTVSILLGFFFRISRYGLTKSKAENYILRAISTCIAHQRSRSGLVRAERIDSRFGSRPGQPRPPSFWVCEMVLHLANKGKAINYMLHLATAHPNYVHDIL